MSEIRLTINGHERGFAGVNPHTRLLDFLRDQGLTGAKEGCAEGECGACAVLVARPDGDDRTRWTSVNA
ncbi:MAG: 2Fe-2S iron-sulfur cluster-binding protein, partial [Kocuria sp.]|nr:2Fe-2S iron-sulfur cluster-binding protein [Kocuria sp.]